MPPDRKKSRNHAKKRKAKHRKKCAPQSRPAREFDLRTEVYTLFGVDVPQISGLELLALLLFSEVGRNVTHAMVKNQVEYHQSVWEKRDEQRQKRHTATLKRQAPRLGYQLTPIQEETQHNKPSISRRLGGSFSKGRQTGAIAHPL